jgi:hypothetical protein
MAKFGRFEFKAKEPAETYEGDHMELDKGYVKILRGAKGGFLGDFELSSGDTVVIVYLDKGQSVREIEPNPPSSDDSSRTERKRSKRNA